MKRNTTFYIMILATLGLCSFAHAAKYKKLAQTGFQFLSVETDARATGMAGAMTTIGMGSSSLFFNPACMAIMTNRFDASLSQNNWIVDIKYNSFSMALNPFQGQYGVIGVSLISVDYGEMQGTMFWGNDKGYIDTEIFHPSAFMVGIGYSKSLSSQFFIGGQVKYTGQQLGSCVVEIEDSLAKRKYKAFATAFDFGTLFKTGWKSLAFGMSVRNFSNEIKYEDEGFQLPLTFSMGISMDLIDLLPQYGKTNKILFAIDAVHPRSYPEYINLGIEYGMKEMLFVRYGFMSNRGERASNFGIGIKLFNLAIDYSYTPFGILNEVQSFTLRFTL